MWRGSPLLAAPRRGRECLGTDGGNPPSESAASCCGVALALSASVADAKAADQKTATASVGGFPPTALGIRLFASTRKAEYRGSGKTQLFTATHRPSPIGTIIPCTR